MERRPALGKGLSALIPDAPTAVVPTLEVDIDRLSPNEFQPRAHVDEARLEELAQSIRSNGVIQPIVVILSSLSNLPASCPAHRKLSLSNWCNSDPSAQQQKTGQQGYFCIHGQPYKW